MIFLHGGVPCTPLEWLLYAILGFPFIKQVWEYAKHKFRGS